MIQLLCLNFIHTQSIPELFLAPPGKERPFQLHEDCIFRTGNLQ